MKPALARWALAFALITAAARADAQNQSEWVEPFMPFKVAGNLYYVGSRGLASYLVTTSQGHILINPSLVTSPALIKASVEKLGFKYADIKTILISHAHWDHSAGAAAMKAATGARYMVMDADVSVVESGGRTDFHYGNDTSTRFPIARIDRILHDGDEVKLGDATLVAHLTPGHTKGCTTWTLKVREGDRTYDVVIVGSPNVNPGFRLVNNSAYPQIASDYEKTFRVLKALPCDIFLGAHGSYFNLEKKVAGMPARKDSARSSIQTATRNTYPTEKRHSGTNLPGNEVRDHGVCVFCRTYKDRPTTKQPTAFGSSFSPLGGYPLTEDTQLCPR